MMMGQQTKAGIAVFTLILVASGCGGGGQSSTDVSFTPNQAVSIQNFSTYPDRVYESQPATVRITLKNTGEATAENMVARLYGAPIDWGGEDLSRAFSNDGSNGQHISFDDVRPGDAEANVPSVPQQSQWMLNPPDLGDRNIDYNLRTRVFYEYMTSAQSDIQLVRQDEFRNQGMTKSQPSLDNTAGPIKMEIRTRTPLIYYEDSTSFDSDVCFIVKNTGDGTPFLPGKADSEYKNIGDNDWTDKVEVSIYDTGGVSFTGGDSSSGDKTTAEVSMVSGNGIQCFNMELPSLTSSEISQTVPITAEADYGYYKDEEASVTVLGRDNS